MRFSRSAPTCLVRFIRGESRRCKGSNEPLRRLPDGALATRRIFFLGAVRRRARSSCARARGSKGVQQALDLQSCAGGAGAGGGLFLSPQRVTQK